MNEVMFLKKMHPLVDTVINHPTVQPGMSYMVFNSQRTEK